MFASVYALFGMDDSLLCLFVLKARRILVRVAAGYLNFHPMAQCAVHALKCLACLTRPSRTL